jgi:hypothetical protein
MKCGRDGIMWTSGALWEGRGGIDHRRREKKTARALVIVLPACLPPGVSMRLHLGFVVATVLVAGCSEPSDPPVAVSARDASAGTAGVAGREAGAGSMTGAATADGGRGGAGGTVDAAAADAADGAPSTGPKDAGRGLDAGRDRPTFEAPVDRPPLPDGQFHYPSLDGKLCGSAEYLLPKFTAEVLMLLDRSGSMGAKFGATSTKWDDAAAVVKATVTNSKDVSWGLKVFPTGAQACAASATVEVPLAAGSAAAIASAVDAAGPPMATLGEGTPTASTMAAATAHLKSLPLTGRKHILLVTDGAPTCRNGNPDTRDEAAAIAAIESATAAGFKTLVIGVATAAADVDTLNKMAVAGGAPRPGAPRYYPASSQAELKSVLDDIVGALTPCLFPLANPPLDPAFVTVTVGSAQLVRDLGHREGWDYANDGAAIQIYGAACDDLKRGAVQGTGIFYGCPY